MLEENPFHKLHIRIQSPKQLPRTIPGQIVRDMLQSAYDEYSPVKRSVLRDILVLELLFSTGLWVSELCSLSVGTFLLGESELRLLVNGKGRKERMLQITTPELIHLAKTYYSEFAKEIEHSGAILLNRQGNPISTQSFRRIVQRYLKRIGSSYHVTPHMFRHPNVKPETKSFSTFLRMDRLLLHAKVFHLPVDLHLIIRVGIHPVDQRIGQSSRQATRPHYLPRQLSPGAFRFFVYLHL